MKQSKLNKQIQTAINAPKPTIKPAQTQLKAVMVTTKKSSAKTTKVAGIKIGFANERIKNTPARKKTAPLAGR